MGYGHCRDCWLLLTTFLLACHWASSAHYWDYIVIGAGPAGLQMGYFLQKSNRSYIIFEKSDTSGNFFTTYPRHDKLVSINKRHTGKTNKEFNLRHDWNSLLSDDESLLFRHYSKEFFPHRATMLQYLKDYQKKLNLNVRLNTYIKNIQRIGNTTKSTAEKYVFAMTDQHGVGYACRTLIVATGMFKPNVPPYETFNVAEGYESISTNPQDYEGKNVLILGYGNAAFETADAIYEHSNLVHIIGRSRLRLAWETHYVGDVRGVNNAVLDTYQLKSLDGLGEGHFHNVKFTQSGDKILVDLGTSDDNMALRDSYDKVIRCLGFVFDDSIFHNNSKPPRGQHKLVKYPKVSQQYEVPGLPGMFITGTAAHSLDHRKSSGGFIHGFRYSVEALHHMLEWKYHRQPWPSTVLSTLQLLSHITKRMNEASGTYQMFSFLGDIYAIRSDEKVEFFKEFPINLLHQFRETTGHEVDGLIVMVMEYGSNYSGPGKDVFKSNRATGAAHQAHKSNFLHPVLYYYSHLPSEAHMNGRGEDWLLPRPDRMHHLVEDFLTSWTAPRAHLLPLRRFLENCFSTDMRQYFSDSCFQMALTNQKLPLGCKQQYMQGEGLSANTMVTKLRSGLSFSL